MRDKEKSERDLERELVMASSGCIMSFELQKEIMKKKMYAKSKASVASRADKR